MSALTVLIIRHAEKPREVWPGPGLTEDGIPDKKSLVIRGWQRAGAWAALFGAGLRADEFPSPAVIYAAKPDSNATGNSDSDASSDPSQRPFETVQPLAERLHLTSVIKFARGDEAKLASEIMGLTGVVLVCWEHKHIVSQLLPALLKDQKLPGVPTNWDSNRFDVVLKLDRTVPDAPWSFRQQFPRLLGDDSDVPLA